jgi:hypothetical protein
MLVYIFKHSRVDISNSAKELSMVLAGSTEGNIIALLCTGKYVIDTDNLGILIRPNLNIDGFYVEAKPDLSVLKIQINALVYPIACKYITRKVVSFSSSDADINVLEFLLNSSLTTKVKRH